MNAGTAEGFRFSHWTITDPTSLDIEAVSRDVSFAFNMPENDIDLTAHWTKLFDVVLLNQRPDASLTNEDGYDGFAEGDNVRAFAGNDTDAFTFTHWETDDLDISLISKDRNLRFEMPGHKVTLEAMFDRDMAAKFVTILGGGTGATVSDWHVPGNTVKIFAGTVEGWRFVRWDSDDVTVNPDPEYSGDLRYGTFTMLEDDVEVTAVFEPLPLSITTTYLPDAEVGKLYDEELEAQGGYGARVWEMIDGDLPDGVEFYPDGWITGTPFGTAAGKFYTIEVEVTDANGTTSEPKKLTFYVREEHVPGEDIVIGDKVTIREEDADKLRTIEHDGETVVLLTDELTVELLDTAGGVPLILTLSEGAMISTETGNIIFGENGYVFNNEDNDSESVGIFVPEGTVINPDGSVELPRGIEELVLSTSDGNVIVDINGVNLVIFEVGGLIDLSSGDASTEPMTIEAFDRSDTDSDYFLIKLYNAVVFQKDDTEQVSPDAVTTLSTPIKAMVIEVGDGNAVVTVGGKTHNVQKGKTITITHDDANNVYHVEFDEDSKKSSGCSTGAGALLALLALAGVSIVSKRRR